MKPSKLCPWCHTDMKPLKKEQLEWSVIDDTFGQYVHARLVHYCFFCGRNLDEQRITKDGPDD